MDFMFGWRYMFGVKRNLQPIMFYDDDICGDILWINIFIEHWWW